ncbi:hypothetical protein DCG74_13325 [Bradyrhizobium sp. WBAH42]|nr:hypothetical protein DAA57_14135 [Bradyrhizobium yuanmingense]UUO28197.1 hypothetical protein DCG74_13325 [Bradyrhizobium sp. WBAH42]
MAKRRGGCNLWRCCLSQDYGAGFLRRCRNTRHCEEPLRRSNPDCLCGKILDCFASLAMTGVEALALPTRRHRGTRAPHSPLTNSFIII